jgi:hypothetical protein
VGGFAQHGAKRYGFVMQPLRDQSARATVYADQQNL